MKCCPDCQLDYPDSSKFCKSCGRMLAPKLDLTEPCPECGAEIQGSWRFCKQCGARNDEATVVRAAPAPASVETVLAPVSMETVQPPVVPVAFSVTCSACGFAQAPDDPFCKGCGRPLVQATSAPHSQTQTYSGPLVSPVSPPAVEPTPVACKTCGHPNAAAVQQCAACGAPIGAGLRKRRAKRAVIAIFTVLVCLILTAGGLPSGGTFGA